MRNVPEMLPDQLTEKFLRWIGKRFYAQQDPLFFQERNLLLQAITFPAHWLEMRGVRIGAKRYEQILSGIIRVINEHGNLAAIRSPGRYLLHAVQEHMKHHGEDYYNQAKSTRNAIEDVMHGLITASAAIQSVDNTVPALAEAHRVLAAAKPGRKTKCKGAATDLQTDFFGPAKNARDSVRDRESYQTVVNSADSAKKFSNRRDSAPTHASN